MTMTSKTQTGAVLAIAIAAVSIGAYVQQDPREQGDPLNLSVSKETPPNPTGLNMPEQSPLERLELAASGDEGAATETLTDLVASAFGNDSARILAALESEGIDPAGITSLPSWGEIESEVFEDAFETPRDKVDRLAVFFAGRLFADGIADDALISHYHHRSNEPITPEERAVVQSVLDDHYPELRASARGVAEELAQARMRMWTSNDFQYAPHVQVPSRREGLDRGFRVESRSTVVRGWHVSYDIFEEEHPGLLQARASLKKSKSKLNHSIGLAVAKYLANK